MVVPAGWWPMTDPFFEREVKSSMVTISLMAINHPQDREAMFCRLIHDFASLEWFFVEGPISSHLEGLMNACCLACGSDIPRVEPTYTFHTPLWDEWALKVNLEACRRVGVRYGAINNAHLIEWLNYFQKI